MLQLQEYHNSSRLYYHSLHGSMNFEELDQLNLSPSNFI